MPSHLVRMMGNLSSLAMMEKLFAVSPSLYHLVGIHLFIGTFLFSFIIERFYYRNLLNISKVYIFIISDRINILG
jgi:hypothetical protein